MGLLNINQLTFHYTGDIILKNVTFELDKGDRVGLVGANGCGKSTLFKLIVNELPMKYGNIFKNKDVSIGYLHQEASVTSGQTLFDEALSAFNDVLEIEIELKKITNSLLTKTNKSEIELLIKRQDALNETFLANDGLQIRSRTEGILKGLGFDLSEFDKKVDFLSGGQKTRLALARLLLNKPDILLLDEPTNHLDLNARKWLEGFLKDYQGIVFVISHDRYFLDMFANKMIEIKPASLCQSFINDDESQQTNVTVYEGNYSRYKELKLEREKAYQNQYKKQQQEISKLKKSIETLKRFNREKSIKRARSMEKRLDKIDALDPLQTDSKSMNLTFTKDVKLSKDILHVENLSKSYGDLNLFKNLSFDVYRQDRLFILGSNGTGKSTLLKIINGLVDKDSGLVHFGTTIRAGYYDQEHEGLCATNTLFEEISNSFKELSITEVRNSLASMLFTGDDDKKLISTLSGGERAKIALLKLMLSSLDFIILDEPTNHLDIESREQLESALENYDGTLLCVSHDRYFIKKLATCILTIEKNGTKKYPYGYETYLKDMDNEKNISKESVKKNSTAKRSYLEEKKYQSSLRKLNNKIEKRTSDATALEVELEEVEKSLHLDENQTDHELLASLYEKKHKIEEQILENYLEIDQLELEINELKEKGV